MATSSAPSAAAGKKETKGKTKVARSFEEKYDTSRTIGADPRDPRTEGSPCHGNHKVAASYRGSVTGSNGHAAWTGREVCKLRLTYTPAFGAHALNRAPGPIPQDVKQQVKTLGQRSCSQPSSSRPSNWVGRGRIVRFAPAGEDPCEKGGIAQECQGRQPSGVLPGEDHTSQERGLQDSRGDEPHSRPQGAQVRSDARGPGVRRSSQVFMEHYLIGFSGNSRGSFSQPVNATSNEEHSIIENDMTVDENYNQDQAEPMILEATEKECEKGGQASADLSDEKEPPYDIHESDTEFLDCGTDHLNVDEVDFLKNVVNDIQEEIDHCLTSCTPSTSDKKADFVELCCEEHSLMSTAWERTGGTAARIGLFNNFNLLTENGTQRALQVIDSHRPKVMWISFPCGAFSSIQNLNELTPEGVARGKMRRKKARKLIRNGIRVIYLGGEIFQEWPRHNSGWQLPEIRELWSALLDLGRFEEIHLDGCMFGLSTKDGLIKKPWKIRCSRPGWLTPLARKCDGTHAHIPALGGTIARQTALYTPKLCRAVCSNLQRGLHEAAAFGTTEVRFNKEDLKTLTEQELNRLIATALKLHRLCGHPNNRALVRNLAARGADKHLLAVANELKCPECHEGQMAVPAVKASLEKEEQLWRTLQMDTFHFKYEGFTYHFLLMLDEASGFSAVHLVMYHLSDEHANITSAQVIDTLQRCWGQYFGLPERIRCDLEGSFRGEMVEDFCHSRGIELSFVPAEHHESTGDVERMIGELKKKMSHHLRNEMENTSPEQAAWQMCAAHNRVARVGGYSPAQWALGRDLEERDNLAIQTAQGDPASEMSHNLQARLRAEATYRKLQSEAKISRALNSRPQRSTQFLPGDLVYFRRWKVPKEKPAHAYLDSPSMKVARFYGPARVLAAETKLQSDGLTRASTNIIWIIAGSKLKKAHSSQLRHASERERLIAKATEAPTLPWTFSALSRNLSQGEYEDLTKEPKKTRTSATTRTATPSGHRSRSRGPRVRAEPSEVPGPSQVPPDAQQAPADESEEELIPAGHAAPPDLSAEQGLDQILQNPPPDIDAQRLLEDPSYMPLGAAREEGLQQASP